MRHGVARVVYGAGSLSLYIYIINRVAPHCVDALMMTLKRENQHTRRQWVLPRSLSTRYLSPCTPSSGHRRAWRVGGTALDRVRDTDSEIENLPV